MVLAKLLPLPSFNPRLIKDKSFLKKTLSAPDKPKHIPTTAQWLSGEGAGSWFNIALKGNNFTITRYSPEGKLECESDFAINKRQSFDITQAFRFDYLSHCQKVVINQKEEKIEFVRLDKKENNLTQFFSSESSIAV